MHHIICDIIYFTSLHNFFLSFSGRTFPWEVLFTVFDDCNFSSLRLSKRFMKSESQITLYLELIEILFYIAFVKLYLKEFCAFSDMTCSESI